VLFYGLLGSDVDTSLEQTYHAFVRIVEIFSAAYIHEMGSVLCIQKSNDSHWTTT